MNITGVPIGRNALAGSGPSMPDPPEVAAWRAQEQARQQRVKGSAQTGINAAGLNSVAALPTSLQTGDRKIDNLTAAGLAMGVPYDELARNAGIALDYATRPMSEGGGKAPDPGLLDMILPAAMGFATGGIGALNGLSALGSSVLGATTSGLFSGNPINAGLGVVGAGAMNALGHLRAVNQPKGFTNTNLGLTGENLSLPGMQNAPGYVPPTQGVGVGALNYVDSLGRATANIPGLSLANAPKPSGIGQYPLGGLTGDMLYNPVSMGGPGASRDIPLPDLPSMGGAGAPGAAGASGGALNEGGAAGPGLVGSTDAGSAGGPSFDATLTGGMGGGKGPGNALAGSGMGAGLIPLSERDMIRNPGYQPRPFGNYVLR